MSANLITDETLKDLRNRGKVIGTDGEIVVIQDGVDFVLRFANPTLCYITQAGAPARMIIPMTPSPE